MLLLLIPFFILNCFASASEQEIKYIQENDSNFNGYMSSKFTPQHNNRTYIDKDENMLLMPVINEFNEEHKNKRKPTKKSPKRTIQKIIKKNRIKLRKMYVNQVTREPTQPPRVEHDNIYAQEEIAQWKDDSTTQSNQRRKPRKWNAKNSRNPMPFSKLQARKDMYRRNKRSDERKGVFILEDLDEVQFLDNNKDNDYNIVNAHVKKYW